MRRGVLIEPEVDPLGYLETVCSGSSTAFWGFGSATTQSWAIRNDYQFMIRSRKRQKRSLNSCQWLKTQSRTEFLCVNGSNRKITKPRVQQPHHQNMSLFLAGHICKAKSRHPLVLYRGGVCTVRDQGARMRHVINSRQAAIRNDRKLQLRHSGVIQGQGLI